MIQNEKPRNPIQTPRALLAAHRLKRTVGHGYTRLAYICNVLMQWTITESSAQKREQAIAMFTQWVGSLILSRASAGKSLSDEIMEVARNSPVLAAQ